MRFAISYHGRQILAGLIAAAAAVAMLLGSAGAASAAQDAEALLKAAFDNWRSHSSKTVVTMTIHRPTWERTLKMVGYTRGEKDALVRFVAPPKEAGNATLKLGRTTWVYNPKLRQVVKLPASLMSQPWMGSDFSYSDLARSDAVRRNYTHKIIATARSGGHTIYTIEAIPKPGAPEVWGKQVLKIRDDGILMEVAYYDQDMKPVRVMKTEKVKRLGGRDYPAVLVMRKLDEPGHWTRIETTEAEFDIKLPNYLFTKSNLSNPRD